MSQWPSTKAKRVLAALLRTGWTIKRQSGSHRTLSRPGWDDVVFAFHDKEEIGPRMLTRIAKVTGLKPEDLKHTAKITCRYAAISPRFIHMLHEQGENPEHVKQLVDIL